ncbi:hypothetical protein GOP47_0016988 [Adiantum capillus-veneris]|uniref:Uncharacterized protein n=1 Tax=Adiantum capillus-veneris TaxID=13818 RepID=A0A9D4UJM7_ADICA|nr:hypothetical protein GOP47_0016988 [Adiantum capillus-veneris]
MPCNHTNLTDDPSSAIEEDMSQVQSTPIHGNIEDEAILALNGLAVQFDQNLFATDHVTTLEDMPDPKRRETTNLVSYTLLLEEDEELCGNQSTGFGRQLANLGENQQPNGPDNSHIHISQHFKSASLGINYERQASHFASENTPPPLSIEERVQSTGFGSQPADLGGNQQPDGPDNSHIHLSQHFRLASLGINYEQQAIHGACANTPPPLNTEKGCNQQVLEASQQI